METCAGGRRLAEMWRGEARSHYHCCRGKGISITCSDYVFVALGIQHAMRMRLVIFLSVASGFNIPTPPPRPTLSNKRRGDRKNY